MLRAVELWEAARARVCEELDLDLKPDKILAEWTGRLDKAHREFADGLAANPNVRIEQQGGRDRIILTGLDRLDEPESLIELNKEIEARMPAVDLPEIVLEVDSWVPYLSDFTHVSEANSRMDNLELSVAAVLTSEATNVGIEPIVHDGVDALNRDRLFWVEQNYIRASTLSAANARLVDYHMRLPLVQAWGGGELASADGLRFVTPIRTLNSGPNPKYFGTRRRGVTFYNFLSDQFSGLHGILIPGTQRDSFFILDGLLEQETALRPVEITSDTHGASEIVFGLFRLMGYQFSPRLADVGSATLYRVDPDADYGPLNPVTRDKIKLKQITAHWDEMLRLAGSLHSGTIKASEALRVLAPGGKPTPTGKAVMELGRLDRSAYLSSYFTDELLRRRVNTQLNRQESRHELARKIFHGQKGELRQSYRDGMEDLLTELPRGEVERPRSSTHGDEIGRSAQRTPREAFPYDRPHVLSSRVVGDHSGSWRIRCRNVRSYGMSQHLRCRGSAGSRRPATRPYRSGCWMGTASRCRRSASSCSTCSLTTTVQLRFVRTCTNCWPGSGSCGPSTCRGTGQVVRMPGTSRCG
ncbi:Tn3 transposase DDE domain protein (plasmid) [Streptomyces sp. YIM 121038]|uniref:Tn3 family transposase n=1 Tax=Streptomyces sp. YIM 121038 TaxID=2136401 RepID=UPI001162C9AF|nr:Tn3 family transposase [Streptomyces sp. YIM 121038]QCX82650.1 Tn3 transposase DDE domain protein [Streptomyces sp. YIM 121038]